MRVFVLSLGSIVCLSSIIVQGCASPNAGSEASAALTTSNGLSMLNGLSMTNGLSMSSNGVSASGLLLNALNSTGLASSSTLMNSVSGRTTASYIVRCALPAGRSITRQDKSGVSYTFAGQIGLAAEWETSTCGTQCQEYVSACLMAHINSAGLHIPIWLDAAAPSVGWGQNASYPRQEGSFFGNLFVSPPIGYYCDGDGFTGGTTGVVAGRINAGGTNAPYSNPFGDGTLCKNTPGVVAYTSPGATSADGYVKLTYGGRGWSNVVTVWRASSYAAVFDASYRYGFYAVATRANPLLIDVKGGGTAAGTPLQQWPQSANLASSRFSVVSNGGYWKIVTAKDGTKCLDAGAGSNDTVVTIQTCNGSTKQQWSFQTNGGYGSAYIKNVGSGRCLSSSSKDQGTPVHVYDCANGSWEEFWIVAAPQ